MGEPLFRAEGTLYPESTRSHLEFRLFLELDYPSLEVLFSYSPKHLEDPALIAELAARAWERFDRGAEGELPPSLQNLLTLSFDDADGFRGAAHRHPPVQTLIVGGQEPSPGLVPGPLVRGLFRVTLSVHAVLTATCTYCLVILPREGNHGLDTDRTA